MTVKLFTQQKEPKYSKSYINDDLGLALTYYKQGQLCLGFYTGKVCPHFQTASPQKPLDQLKSDFIWNIYA